MIRFGITAHRGSSKSTPENTKAAFVKALALGVPWVEADVRQTKDGQFIICHDESTGRTCNQDLVIAQHTWDELKHLDAAWAFRRQHHLDVETCPVAPLPLLSDILDLFASQFATRLSLHLKTSDRGELLKLAREKMDLKQLGMNDSRVETLLAARHFSPLISLFWDRLNTETAKDDIRIAQANQFQALVFPISGATSQLAKTVKQSGLSPGLWVVNEAQELRRFQDMGFHHFYSDCPEELIIERQRAFREKFEKAPEIIGHRGCSQEAPENTMPSIKKAWAQNSDAVEIDIYLTRDNEIIAIHDETLKRYTGIEKEPRELTRRELENLDFGKWKDPKYAGTPPAFFDQILPTIPPGKRLLTEIKTGPEIVPFLIKALANWGGDRDRVAFICFSLEVLKQIRLLLPSHEAYWLVDFQKKGDTWLPDYRAFMHEAQALGLAGIDVGTQGPYGPAFRELLQQKELGLIAWTINDPGTANKFLAMGAHGLTTDNPGYLRKSLEK